MKKWQLFKIQELISSRRLKHTNYQRLLEFSDDEIKIVMDNIDKEISPTLIEFFSLLKRQKYDFKDFERLEIENVKEIVTNKIINAKSNELAIIIFNWFKYKIDKFQTKEEWFTFMDNLDTEICVLNLSYVLDNFKAFRVEAIEKIMKNPISLRVIYLSEVNKQEKYDERYLLDLLDLTIMKYNVALSIKLVQELAKAECESNYTKILNYLKNPVVFNRDLPKLFLGIDAEESEDTICLLNKIDDEKLLEKYLSFNLEQAKNERLRKYINKIVDTDDSKLKESFGLVLENKEYFEKVINEDDEKLDTIVTKLEEVNSKDDRSIITAKLLEKIPYDVWMVIPNDFSLYKLEFLYQNSKTFLKILNILDKDFVINRLNYFSLTCIKKIFGVLKFKTFIRNFHMKDELIKLFNIENESSIDNAYKIYLLQEEKNKILVKEHKSRIDSDSEMQIRKICNLLDSGYDINLLLDGFDDDEEITPKTIIKTRNN